MHRIIFDFRSDVKRMKVQIFVVQIFQLQMKILGKLLNTIRDFKNDYLISTEMLKTNKILVNIIAVIAVLKGGGCLMVFNDLS